jgi:hypothetical protein
MLSTGELFAVKRIESMGKDIRLVDAQLAGERLALNVRSNYINSPLGIVQRECGWDIIFPEVFDCDLRTLRQVYVEHLEPALKQKVICDSVSPLLCILSMWNRGSCFACLLFPFSFLHSLFSISFLLSFFRARSFLD